MSSESESDINVRTERGEVLIGRACMKVSVEARGGVREGVPVLVSFHSYTAKNPNEGRAHQGLHLTGAPQQDRVMREKNWLSRHWTG